jgi:hypothetical protein
LALQTPKFYLAGSKRARKSGFLRSIDSKNPQFEQALRPASVNRHHFYPFLGKCNLSVGTYILAFGAVAAAAGNPALASGNIIPNGGGFAPN